MQTLDIQVYGKDNCPFCVKTVDTLKAKNLQHTYTKVTSPEELPNPRFRSVPQIVINGTFIGGYSELSQWLGSGSVTIGTTSNSVVGYSELSQGLGTVTTGTTSNSVVARAEAESIVNARKDDTKVSFFNTENKGHLTGKYPLFLGDELGFSDTIYQPYPILEVLFDQQMAQIWNHTEVDLTQDRIDMSNVDRNITELMVENIIWQTLMDGVAARAIGATIGKHVTNPALQDLYNSVILFESIHTKTYLHIIRQCFDNPVEVMARGYSNFAAIKRSQHLLTAFENLANHRGDEASLRKLIMFCVAALFLMEAINFQSSFAVTFAIAERGYYQGISQNVVLIARDEMLHAQIGATVFKLLAAEWPDTYKEIQPMLADMLKAVVFDERSWTEHLFSNGRYVLGLSKELLLSYVDYCALTAASVLDCDFTPEYLKENKLPLKYMEKYLDSSKVQVAAQELQVTSYLLNSVRMSSDEEINNVLAKLRNELC